MFSSKLNKVVLSVFIILFLQVPFLFAADDSEGVSFGFWDVVQIALLRCFYRFPYYRFGAIVICDYSYDGIFRECGINIFGRICRGHDGCQYWYHCDRMDNCFAWIQSQIKCILYTAFCSRGTIAFFW